MNTLVDSNSAPEARPELKLFVCCLVDSEWQAMNIVDRFRSAGYARNKISVVFPGRSSPKGGLPPPTGGLEEAYCEGVGPEVLERALGWLSGFSAAQMPPLGTFFGAGPMMQALSAWSHPFICDLTMALRTFGVSEPRAQYYADHLQGGEILLATHSSEIHRARETERVFSRVGAKDICSFASFRSADVPSVAR